MTDEDLVEPVTIDRAIDPLPAPAERLRPTAEVEFRPGGRSRSCRRGGLVSAPASGRTG